MCLGIPGRVESVTESGNKLLRTGKVRFGEILREVNLAYTPEAEVGDYVIVHVGFAISVIDEAEAGRVFETLTEFGEEADDAVSG